MRSPRLPLVVLLGVITSLICACPPKKKSATPPDDTTTPGMATADSGPGDVPDALEELPAFLTLGQVVANAPAALQDCTQGVLAPLPDPEGRLFRIAHPDFDGNPFTIPVNTELGGVEHPVPLVFELDIQQDIRSQIASLADVHVYVDRNSERSVIQIELPSPARPAVNEHDVLLPPPADPGTPLFHSPRFCALGNMDSGCRNFEKPGFWRAVLIRPRADNSCELHQLQLARTFPDELDPQVTKTHRVVGVWSHMDLEFGDRIRFGYWGRVPRRSTELLAHDGPLAPRVRLRNETASPSCTMSDAAAQANPECWTLLQPNQVEAFTITPDAPAFVHVVSPLDVRVNDNVTVQVVMTDRWGNPTHPSAAQAPTAPVEVLVYEAGSDGGNPFCTIPLPASPTYRGSCTAAASAPPTPPYDVRFGVDVLPPNAVQIYNYTRVHADAHLVRKVGDTHVHSAFYAGHPFPVGPPAFVRSWTVGDHRAESTDMRATLEYLEKVSVYDFGALSQHAIGWPAERYGRKQTDAWAIPDGTLFAPFRAGGKCELDLSATVSGLGDWWTAAQQVLDKYQRDSSNSGSEFVVYPAFEWHGEFQGDENADNWSPLHRVVVYRDFHSQTNDLPMLPGTTLNRSPLCLLLYLQNHLRLNLLTLAEVVVIPHMMRDRENNIDWDLTYGIPNAVDTLLGTNSKAVVEKFQTVGEIYSARNWHDPGGQKSHAEKLFTFETARLPVTNDYKPFTYRYGWRDTGAMIGIIGSSDNHGRTPGVNDDKRANGGRYDKHEPAGTAVVITNPRVSPLRNAIFKGFRSRRTYGTTGVRAWLNFWLNVDGTDVALMGEEVGCVATSSTAILHVKLMVGSTIGKAQIFVAEPGNPAVEYNAIFDDQPLTETWTHALALNTPPPNTPHPEGRRLYYFRAILSDPADPNKPEEVVWSSPIWVTWSNSCQ